MSKRVLLFIATNLLVIASISIVTSVLGLHSYLKFWGINYFQLVAFSLIWGSGGALISLFLSKFIATFAMNIVIIDAQTATRDERFIIDMIHSLAKKAGLAVMPAFGIYPSQEVNAFTTGRSQRHALIAVSSRLLNQLNRDEIEAVLSHEITHIANGDMVTMTLLQGVVNSFALFLSRILAYTVSLSLARDDKRSVIAAYVIFNLLSFLFDLFFTYLGNILVAAYSRTREFRADQGGANLAGRDKMIAALKRLQQSADSIDERAPSLAAFKITQQPHWLELFSSHPTLEKRIERLQKMK